MFLRSEYQKELEVSQAHLESILAETDSSLDLLSTLSEAFKAVKAQTAGFEEQCKGIMQEQKRISKIATDIEENLKHYRFLEPVTKRLNAPTVGAMVKTQEFSDLLTRLDECLEYMSSHVGDLSILIKARVLIGLAYTTRSCYLSIPLSFTADQRPDSHSEPICQWCQRNCYRCITTHSRQATQRHHNVHPTLCQIPGRRCGAKGAR